MRIRRLLIIPAVAALAASATLLGTAGTASAASAGSVARTAVVAQQHGGQVGHGTAVAADESDVVFSGYFNTELECSIAGASLVGHVLGGGVVFDWECFFDGEPGPLGPWELWLFVEPLNCPASQVPARVGSPEAKVC